jgi:hypothetical protein
MPFTSPEKRLWARKLSSGTLSAKRSRRSGSWPQVKSDIGAGSAVSQSASAAAIFIGCTRVWAWVWPTTITAIVATKP